MSRKVILPVLLVIVVIVAGFYEISSYEQSVVSVTVVSGTITTVQLPTSAPGAAPAGGLGGAGGAAVPAVGGSSSLTYVVISVGTTSITQALPCSNVFYRVGQKVAVAEEQLRDGQQRLFPDVACQGQLSPYRSVEVSRTTSSSSSSQ